MSPLRAISVCALLSLSAVTAQDSSIDFRKVLLDVQTKAKAAKTYEFEGELLLEGQKGSAPAKLLSKAKVRLAVAPKGKYLLRIEPADKDEYMLVSDGEKSWAYVPKLKQYTEQESAVETGDDQAQGEEQAGSDDEHDMAETFVRLVVPTLATLGETAKAANIDGTHDVKYEGKKQRWPVLRVLSKPDEKQGQSMVELAFDPATLSIGRFAMANRSGSKEESTVIRMILDFSSFHMGENLPDSTFVFDPPKKAKLAETVPIPGQTGSFLLNHPAPDFELKTLDGERVRLADLRGKPVLLSFWASWCPPCRRELPGLAKISDEYKSKGLVVLGVNDEDKGTARKYATQANLPFDTLNDGSYKVHRLFRVHSIPTVFVIDSNGTVVKFFKGARDEAALRVALKSAGL